MNWLVTPLPQLGIVASKAVLLYLTAVVLFRLGERRTLAEMSAFDFIAAVACGGILGRVPNATGTAYAAGAVTLAAILGAHAVLTRMRQFPALSRLTDHAPRLLVAEGQVLSRELRRAGLTRDDLDALLREQGVRRLAEVRYAVFEHRGNLTLVRANSDPDGGDDLVAQVLGRARRIADSAGSPVSAPGTS